MYLFHLRKYTYPSHQGYSGGGLYDGQYIANTTNTIVVTTNYRLGAIGFLVYGYGGDAIEGNFGFRVS